jgi:TolB protein
MTMYRSIRTLAGLLAFSLVASAAGGTASAAPLPSRAAYLHAGQTGPRSAVPWKQVGPDWVLSMYWPGKPADSTLPGPPRSAVPVLYLFNPAGGRYRIQQFPKSDDSPGVADWSGDGTRALVTSGGFGPAEQVVLKTGKISQIKLPKQAVALSYTGGAGQEVLAAQLVGKKSQTIQIDRYDLDGRLGKVLVSDAVGISAVYNDSGTQLAVNAPNGIWLVNNNGGIIRKLPVAGATACIPARWWNESTILVSCQATAKSRSRLWLLPAAGGKARALTPQRGRHSIDLGDFDAWPLRGTTYLQGVVQSSGLNNPGPERILHQPAGRHVTTVTARHMPKNDSIFATHRSRLLVLAQNDCNDYASLLWFNPTTGQEQPLITGKPGVAGAEGAAPFGGVRKADSIQRVFCNKSVTKQLTRP